MSVSNYIHDGSVLTAAATTQGTVVPPMAKRIIRAATICNSTAAAIAATVYLVPDGINADATNTLISARPIAPGESYPCPELVNQGLNAGGAVKALGAGLTFKYTATDII